MVAKDLQYYADRFSKLKLGKDTRKQYDKPALYKPILLLSLIQLIQEGIIKENKISVSFVFNELKNTFIKYQNQFGTPPYEAGIEQPLYYLERDGFWHLKEKSESIGIVSSRDRHNRLRGKKRFEKHIEYAKFDDELFCFLQDSASRKYLIDVIFNAWFPDETEQIKGNIEKLNKHSRGTMYNDELEPITIALDKLLLDPNNPRFSTERQSSDVKDAKIPDTAIQERTQKNIEAYSVDDLRYSILRNGFLKLDRIVVRTVEGHGGMYVVVEGNRRLAALKSLHRQIDERVIDEDGIDEEYLDKLKSSTESIEVLLYKGQQEDISWFLQGIRHISGIKDWQPAQRAQLVAKLIERNMSFTEVGQKFGLSAKAVGRLYRAYKGLEQMRADDEYGSKAQNDYFSLFEEAYRNSKVREWLKWDNDNSYKFTNIDNLKQFYSWIVPDDENDNKRRIHDPKHVRILDQLLAKRREDLIAQIDQHEISIESAWGRAAETQGNYNWQVEIDEAKKAVNSLPNQVFIEYPEAVKSALIELRDIITQTITRLDK